jgi:methylenetetrahydrofolate reductase (NADPH)
MTIAKFYGMGQFGLSFELFPPKTAIGMTRLAEQADKLVKYSPDYITCTYGAGGSTQDRTLEVITGVRKQHQLPVATHLTCVGSTVEQLRDYLVQALQAGVQNVVALRGDPPQGETRFTPTAGGFQYANELVSFIRSEFPEMGIAVGGYPETHQEAASSESDLINLQRKVDAGADLIITQLFYHNDDFYRFREQCEQRGIRVPIVPGLLPVTNLGQIQRIASLCGAKLPQPLIADLQNFQDDLHGQFEVGVKFANQQVQELVAQDVAGLHFYVLNKSAATGRALEGVQLPGR